MYFRIIQVICLLESYLAEVLYCCQLCRKCTVLSLVVKASCLQSFLREILHFCSAFPPIARAIPMRSGWHMWSATPASGSIWLTSRCVDQSRSCSETTSSELFRSPCCGPLRHAACWWALPAASLTFTHPGTSPCQRSPSPLSRHPPLLNMVLRGTESCSWPISTGTRLARPIVRLDNST